MGNKNIDDFFPLLLCPISVKFECLESAVFKSDSTEAELSLAWSKLTAAELGELQGGKMEFNAQVEFAPLHWAAAHGNLKGVEFLLVSNEN